MSPNDPRVLPLAFLPFGADRREVVELLTETNAEVGLSLVLVRLHGARGSAIHMIGAGSGCSL